MAEGSSIDDVFVFRMDADLADRLGILETGKFPCLPGIFRFINPFSGHRIAADT